MKINREPSKLYQMIALNAQKGDPYSVKFKDDPIPYVGVPVLDMTAAEKDRFSFKILEPQDCKGMVEKSIEDIEWIAES
jgi:hypothetical protein